MPFKDEYQKAKHEGKEALLAAGANIIAFILWLLYGHVIGMWAAIPFIIHMFSVMIALSIGAQTDHAKNRILKEVYKNMYESDEEEYF